MNAALIALSPEQWATKRQTIARNIAGRYNRSPELWHLYTPEAEQLMRRTWYEDNVEALLAEETRP